MARRLQQMLEDVRKHWDHLTIWLRPEIMKAMYVNWNTDQGFKNLCLMNRANRASAKSLKYIGGSATFMKTKARLSKSLDRDATMTETFKYTHMLKENNERFAYQRAADHYMSKHHPVDPEDSVDLREQVLLLTWSFTNRLSSCRSLRRGIKKSSHA
ncbi:hypothetical protein Ahy_A03g012111 [Arachis hypogaea]|uniref:Uncharacterized protein n=1 Tax=Arachis hypogaea TaxID=3818 RepID=A0A445DSJ7_ARAHY|nr:hypothetical protein Ahy_A03g012111 [Arachis hypogaea]